MLPSERPEKMAPRFSVRARRASIDFTAEIAAKRTLLSFSLAGSVSGNSTLLIAGDELCDSARTALRRTAGSVLRRLACACACLSKSLILASLSFSSARANSGAIDALTLFCNFCAAARRTLLSGSNRLSAANAFANSPRMRLLTVIDSGLSGIGTAKPVAASSALPSATMTTRSPARNSTSSAIAFRIAGTAKHAQII